MGCPRDVGAQFSPKALKFAPMSRGRGSAASLLAHPMAPWLAGSQLHFGRALACHPAHPPPVT